MKSTNTGIRNFRKFYPLLPEVGKSQALPDQLEASIQQALPAILKLQFTTGGASR